MPPPTVVSLVRRTTPDIDPVQQGIYDYIESLERNATSKIIASSSNQGEIEVVHSNISGEHQVEEILKQEIYELEILNRHLKQENEAVKSKNEIHRNQNDNILLHLGFWYKKNKKLTARNKFLKRKIMGL